jgi:hypothetical protein
VVDTGLYAPKHIGPGDAGAAPSGHVVCRDSRCTCPVLHCLCHDAERHHGPPEGMCADLRCKCTDPACPCHWAQDHRGQPASVGMNHRTAAEYLEDAPVAAQPGPRSEGSVTVTMSEGDDEDLRGFYARMQQGASSDW